MKLIKAFVVFIIVLAVVFFIITILLPSKYQIEREITIRAPKTLVYYLISDLHNWKFWDRWFSLDSNQIRKYEGPLFGRKSSFHWISKKSNVGVGSLEIVDERYLNKVSTKMILGRGLVANSDLSIEETSHGTKVQWELSGSLSFVAKWFRFFMDKSAGEDLQIGLYNLKALAERNWSEKVYCFLDSIPTIYYVGILDSSSMNPLEVYDKFSDALRAIDQFINNKGLIPIASSIAISLSYAKNFYKFIAGIPVENLKNAYAGESIIIDSIPSSKVVKAIYVGAYNNLKAAYTKIFEYMQNNNIQPRSYSFELYVTDPTKVKPEENITLIYFLI